MITRLVRYIACVTTLACATLVALPVRAVIDYGDGSGTQVFSSPVPVLANYEGTWGSFLGTPIAPNYFIAAKHVGGNIGDTFTINSQNYTTTAEFSDPSADLIIWQVDPNGPSFTASEIAPLYPSYPTSNQGYELYNSVGSNLVVTGRGTAIGSQISINGVPKGWYWGSSNGVQSWGTNKVTAFASGGTGLGTLLQFSFDATGGFDEGALSSGDSSGGVFIQDPNDGTWKLAGLNYAVDGPFQFQLGRLK